MDTPGDSAGTPERQRAPRVLAVVHARSGEQLVAALAGLAAQSHQPDLLVAVDCLPPVATRTAGSDPAPAAAPAAGSARKQPADDPTDQPVPDPQDDGPISDAFAIFGDLTDDTDPELAQRRPDTGAVEAVVPADEALFGDDVPTGAHDMDAMLQDADGRPVVDQGHTHVIATSDSREQPDPRDVLGAHCDAVITLASRATVNEAVAAALAWADEHEQDQRGTQDWIWLLGDSDRPSMKALEHLIDSVKLSPNVAVVGAKHRAGATGRDLVDVGITTTRWGRILTQVEPGEPDQGQRDHISDTLAVPLSGMLVRRDVWEKLRGLDPAMQSLPTLDAAVDFCRRVWLAGHRVEVQPTAVLTAPTRRTPEVSRRARTHRRLTGAPVLALPVVAASVVLGAVLRLIAGIIAKEPFRALHHAAASLVPLLRPDQVLRARWRAFRTHKVPRRRLTPLLASTKATWRWQRERWQRSRPRLVSPAGRDAAPLASWRPGVLVLLLAVAGVLALVRIARPGPFSSASMPAVTAELKSLWLAALSSWVPADLGHPGPVDPLVSVLAMLGTPLASPRLAALILLLLALPLAGWAAWWATGGLTRRAAIRALCALAWAGSPVLLLAVADARLPLVLMAIFLPLAVRAIGQSIASHARRSGWAWAAAGGLLLVPSTAGFPILTLIFAALLLLVAARTRRLAVALAAAPPIVVSLPMLLAAIERPAVLFTEAGTPLARTMPPGWAALLGWPVIPQDGPSQAGRLAHHVLDDPLGVDLVTTVLHVLPWLTGVVPAVLAVIGVRVLLRGSPRGAVARTGWMLAAGGVVLVAVSGWVTIAADSTGEIGASASAGTLLAVFGLLVAGAGGWGAPGQARIGFLAATGRALRRVAGVLLAAVPVLTILGWAATQFLAPAATNVHNGANPPMPAAVVDAAESADAVRTVTVRVLPSEPGSGTASLPDLQIAVLRGDGPGVANQSSAMTVADRGADPADQALAEAVVRTVRGDADARELLAPFGVGSIVLLPAADDADDSTTRVAARLDSALGLGPAGRVGDVRAWRVNSVSGEATAPDRAAAVRIVPAEVGDGPAWIAVPSANLRVDTDVSSTAGTLVLAERFDPGWQASLNGRELEPVRVDGWAQGFEIGSGDGRLVVEHRTTWHRAIGWAQIIVLLGAVLIALPVRNRPEPQVQDSSDSPQDVREESRG